MSAYEPELELVNETENEIEFDLEEATGQISELNAEAWAVGQRGGIDVGSDDPTYQRNAKYYAAMAEEYAREVSNKLDKPTSVAPGKFLQTDANGDAVWGNAASPTDVANAVTDWLGDNIPAGQTVVVDQSLTVSGAAADSKKTGDEIAQTNQEVSDLKSAIGNVVTLTMTGGNIGNKGEINVVPSSTYYLITQAIDISATGKVRIKNYYSSSSLSTYSILDKYGNVIKYLLNPASGQDHIDIDIPETAKYLYVMGTSSKTPIVELINDYNRNGIPLIKGSIDAINECEIDGYRRIAKWVNGVWSGNNLEYDNKKMIIPITYVKVLAGDTIQINTGSFAHAVAIWTGTIPNGTRIRSDSSYSNSNETIEISNDGYFVVAFANASDQSVEVNPDDLDAVVTITSYFTRYLVDENTPL